MKIKIKEVAKEKKGYSLYKLAQIMDLPQQTIYSWAKGRTQPTYLNLDKLDYEYYISKTYENIKKFPISLLKDTFNKIGIKNKIKQNQKARRLP